MTQAWLHDPATELTQKQYATSKVYDWLCCNQLQALNSIKLFIIFKNMHLSTFNEAA